ncbi:MAG: M48 family metalloprotease [Alphaproteobacteria bacterium]|nr:M48 family metalloprotease [Alphaproteobacteria bacterium]
MRQTGKLVQAIGAVLALMVMSVLAPGAATAQGFIRDTEVESVIRDLSAPIFDVAGLTPSAVRIHLINSPDFNAFVAGGQRVFINTGVVLRSEDVGELLGVIAHETGHIAGGHLVRLRQELASAGPTQILATILGAAAGIASGNAQVGAAIATGTSVTQQRLLLAYSRVQESAADQAALTYLDDLRWSARGFQQSMGRLAGQELRVSGAQAEYLRSHPLSRDRLSAITAHVETSPYSDRNFPADFGPRYDRIRAKIAGFTQSLSQIFTDYPVGDDSVPARYARAVAHHRASDPEQALAAVDALIADFPEDPYFHELKGQFLTEQGRPADSVAPYRQALALKPDSPLVRIALAQSLLALRTPEADREALALTRTAVQFEPYSINGWRQLAIAEGRNGDIGLAALALAEMNWAAGNARDAIEQSKRATALLPVGSPGALRAEDIETFALRELRRR